MKANGHALPEPSPPEEIERRQQVLHGTMVQFFTMLQDKGLSPVEINGMAIAMCRQSLVGILGIETAAAWDKEARINIGWPE